MERLRNRLSGYLLYKIFDGKSCALFRHSALNGIDYLFSNFSPHKGTKSTENLEYP